MSGTFFQRKTVLTLLFVLCAPVAAAAEIGDESAGYTVETVYSALDHPEALVVRRHESDQGPHELFIADSGAGRVVKVVTSEPPQASAAVEGFETGPFALVFITRTKLLVGLRGEARSYPLPLVGATLVAASADHTTRGDTDNQITSFGLGDLGKQVFATQGGTVMRGEVTGNRLTDLRRFVAKSNTGGLGYARCAVMTPRDRPRFLVVADSGKDEPGDSVLRFYDPQSGSPALSLPVPLDSMVALAYSPTGNLYAADAGWNDPGKRGVYRLDEAIVDRRQTCRPVLVAHLPQPTALVFAPDGGLYATLLGDDETKSTGALVRVNGDF